MMAGADAAGITMAGVVVSFMVAASFTVAVSSTATEDSTVAAAFTVEVGPTAAAFTEAATAGTANQLRLRIGSQERLAARTASRSCFGAVATSAPTVGMAKRLS